MEFGEAFGVSTQVSVTRVLWGGSLTSADNFSVRLFTVDGYDPFGGLSTTLLTTLTGNISSSVGLLPIYDSDDLLSGMVGLGVSIWRKRRIAA